MVASKKARGPRVNYTSRRLLAMLVTVLFALPVRMFVRDDSLRNILYALFVVAMLLWFGAALFYQNRREVQKDRFFRGLCLSCGYDLRGQLDRCPECGRSVKP